MFNYFSKLILFSCFSLIFSQTINDLDKMKSEYQARIRNEKEQININREQLRTGSSSLGRAEITPYKIEEIEKDSLDNINRFFGYNFFTRRDTVSFWENLPTPNNYLLGSGDELVISLWGATQLRKTYVISRDGKIYDEKVGLLNLMGKTIGDAELYLLKQFGRVYSTLKGQNATTFMDVSLGQLRSINVNFVGHVAFPGVYPVHPFSNVITGLIQAGGLDTTGSLRNIVIKRENKTFSTIDLYDYLIKGNIPTNIQLRDQDIVVVPTRLSTVTIDSAVIRPGIYESKPNENILQMINYAGGLKSNASTIVGLKRINSGHKSEINYNNIENYYIDYKNSHHNNVQDGDIITVNFIFETILSVEIIGQVKRPGIYYFFNGMTMNDLIYLSGGLEDSTFLKSVYTKNAEIVRRNPDTRYESVIEISLDSNKWINNKNIPLQNLDRIVVHANRNFFERENIQVNGEVNIPGSYPLITDNETLSSLLIRAGGVTSKAQKNGISIFRNKKYFESYGIVEELKFDENINENNKKTNIDKVKVAWINQSIALMPGDSIVVKEVTGTVQMLGEIHNEGLIEYKKGKSLNYYLDASGGITELGNKKDIIVIYSNGVISPKKWFSSPKITDGATIIVNKKEFIEPFNPTVFAATLASFLSSLVTIILLTNQLGGGS